MNQAEQDVAFSPNSHDRRPVLVTFSGIDGAGKTTQIDALLAWLHDSGIRVRILRFWDDIAVLGSLREAMSHGLLKSETGVGSPHKPVQRRDKNVRAWYMTLARHFLYCLDAVHLGMMSVTASRRNTDVIIFDRYLYDELANLDLGNPVSRIYAYLLLKFVPSPDVAFLLDADPVQARTRKPEYPLDFLHTNRASYLALSALAGGMTVIAPQAAEEVTHTVLQEVGTALGRNPAVGLSRRQPSVCP